MPVLNRDAQRGSIPARAGEPAMNTISSPAAMVYPRACGGTVPSQARPTAAAGLSPRVRGNRRRLHQPPNRHRSIPARAGEPNLRNLSSDISKVYPRACGGTTPRGAMPDRWLGLSPRVRGNRADAGPPRRLCRSIPARAGEPKMFGQNTIQIPVYPRACGGTRKLPGRHRSDAGLSPRVRGNQVQVIWPSLAPRSIPARAGEPPTTP